jgi:hypothetical protein
LINKTQLKLNKVPLHKCDSSFLLPKEKKNRTSSPLKLNRYSSAYCKRIKKAKPSRSINYQQHPATAASLIVAGATLRRYCGEDLTETSRVPMLTFHLSRFTHSHVSPLTSHGQNINIRQQKPSFSRLSYIIPNFSIPNSNKTFEADRDILSAAFFAWI